jgi:hypothetical protein
MIKLLVTLGKSVIDNEGESKVTLIVPLEYRDQAMELMKCNDKVIELIINENIDRSNLVSQL